MEEFWKDIEGYEGYYQVSDLGRVKSLDRKVNHGKISINCKGKILIKTTMKQGYSSVGLCVNGVKKTGKVHRLVAEAFIPNLDNKIQVNHINGIKTDNRVENLEWCNNSENQLHSYSIGLSKSRKGLDHHKVKLTEGQVREVKYGNKKEKGLDLANRFGVDPTVISKIKKGKTWKHI